MSSNRQSIYDLLSLEPSDNFLSVLSQYIDKINPKAVEKYWERPLRETIMLHFCLVNSPEKLHDYYQHYAQGQLDSYLDKHPVPQSLAEGAGQMMSWFKAMILKHELMRSPVQEPPLEPDAKPAPIQHYNKHRFMPTNRRPPTTRLTSRKETDAGLSV